MTEENTPTGETPAAKKPKMLKVFLKYDVWDEDGVRHKKTIVPDEGSDEKMVFATLSEAIAKPLIRAGKAMRAADMED